MTPTRHAQSRAGSGTPSLSLATIQAALHVATLDAPAAHRLMAPRPRARVRLPDRPGQPRQGGVLVLLFPTQSGELDLVLTRRSDGLTNHRGQISLPGGARDEGESLPETAIRETCEELGICLDSGQLLGRLASLYIPPSDFEIYPFVAYVPWQPVFRPAPAEVAEVFQVPVADLLRPDVHHQEVWQLHNLSMNVPFYQLGGHKVWGATAMVLSELEQRLCLIASTRSPYTMKDKIDEE